MAYWTPQALPKLRTSEGRYDQIHYPSGYTSSGVRSSASGGYGFLDSTWRTFAPQAGVDTNQYPRAYMAPPAVQDQVASITPVSNWTCAGCNSTASALARNPVYVSSTPQSVSGGSGGDPSGFSTSDDPAFTQPGGGGTNTTTGGTASSGDYGGGTDYIFNPETGTYFNPDTGQVQLPGTPGLSPPAGPGTGEGTPGDLGTGGTGGLPAILSYGWDKLIRIALILLGVLLVIVAAWAMVEGEFRRA